MAEKRYQVFVSSTFTDLVSERVAVQRVILDLGHIPSGMELFPAADIEQLRYIKQIIEESDYYVLIIGGRYGSVDSEGVSFTEREYDYAVEKGKTVLVFPHGSPDEISLGKSEKDETKRKALVSFTKRASQDRLVKYWNNTEELTARATISLVKAFNEFPQVGWVRADKVPTDATLIDVQVLRERISVLETENQAMKLPQKEVPADAAGLDDNFALAVKYKRTFQQSEREGYWGSSFANFFDTIAPNMFVAYAVSMATSALEREYKHREGVYSVEIRDQDVYKILFQFVTLGLMEMKVMPGKDEVIRNYFWVNESGRRLFMARNYVRKPPQS